MTRHPVPPDGLGKSGKKVWKRIVSGYAAGHFSEANLYLLEQLCRAWEFAERCGEEIEESGLLIDGKVNPLIAARAQAWAEVRHCATKLRLAISSTTPPDAKGARPDPNARLAKPWEL